MSNYNQKLFNHKKLQRHQLIIHISLIIRKLNLYLPVVILYTSI